MISTTDLRAPGGSKDIRRFSILSLKGLTLCRKLMRKGSITSMKKLDKPKEPAPLKKWHTLYLLVVFNTALSVLALALFTRIFTS